LAQFPDAFAAPHEAQRGALKRQRLADFSLQVTLVVVAEQRGAVAKEGKSGRAVADLVRVVDLALAFAGHGGRRLPLHRVAHLWEENIMKMLGYGREE